MQFIMKFKKARGWALALLLTSFAALAACTPSSGDDAKASASCPEGFGWSEGLVAYTDAKAAFPVSFSADADDCLFQQWSWEAFVWATAEVDGKPRFMALKTMELLEGEASAGNSGLLQLQARSTKAHNNPAVEHPAAFTEADGSVLVGQNGYPVYASVHMNDSYFATVKANLIESGAYKANKDADKPGAASADCGKDGLSEHSNDAYFACGATVFKATWLRLAIGEEPPEGAYVTEALVPVLKNDCRLGGCTVVATDETTRVNVALVGLHVVSYIEHHPEFVWATFEHNNNSPAFADGTFEWNDNSDPKDYTFYAANTPFTKDNIIVSNQPAKARDEALLTFDEEKQTFSPITQVVQMNKTGGENQTNGAENIAAVHESSQGELRNLKSTFANYFLVGAVWLEPDTYTADNPEIVDSSVQWNTKAVGGMALANMTAETFMQQPGTGDQQNCFLCHNPQSYSYSKEKMPLRRVAISHMLAVDSSFAVPNQAASTDAGAEDDSEAGE